MADEKDGKKEEKKVRIFHTGGIYGPLDTAEGRLNPGSSLEVSPKLAKKFVGAYKHVKLASDVIPAGSGDSKELDALKKEVEELKTNGEEIVKKYDALEVLYADSQKGEKALVAIVAEFLKVSDKKLGALQKKHADALKTEEAPEPKP